MFRAARQSTNIEQSVAVRPPEIPRTSGMKSHSYFLLAVGLVAIGSVAAWFYRAAVFDPTSQTAGTYSSSNRPDTASPTSSAAATPADAFARVLAQGRVVPRSGLINIYGPPNQIVESIPVIAGQAIVSGQTELATFQLQRRLALQAELAVAQADEARRELEQKLALAASQVAAAEAARSLAELQVEQTESSELLQIPVEQLAAAQTKLTRLEALAQDPATEPYIAANALEQQRLAITEAEIQLRHARKKQAAAVQAARLDLESAQRAVQQAREALAALQTIHDNPRAIDLSVAVAQAAAQEARLLAPLDGVVVRILARPGDVALTMPLMQVADLRRMDCVAEVPDRMIRQIRIGQTATVRSPSLTRDLSAEVVEISRVVGNSSLPDPNPLAIVDRRTVEVRLELSPADVAIAADLIHLQVSIEF